MTKTIKQIAAELGVSKPTISKAISELGIQAEQIGNRYVLNEMQISKIKSKLMQKSKTENEKKTENSQENLKRTEEVGNDQSFQFLQAELDVLAQQGTGRQALCACRSSSEATACPARNLRTTALSSDRESRTATEA